MELLETATTFNLPDERVGAVGDLHGNVRWVQALLPAMHRHDPSIRTVLQVGDYGFEHSGRGTHPVDFWAEKSGIERVLVTLGNHEAWEKISPAQEATPGSAIRASEVVWLLPRPFRFTIAGREVLSLGGASSVDKAFRTPGKDWFEDELITEEMENAAIAAGAADVLLTHESPVEAPPEVLAIIASNPDGYPPDAMAISAAQRERVQRVSNAVRPAMHFHGHMHTYGSVDRDNGRRVFSLDRDTRAGNAGILDMKTLTFETLPHDLRRR